jgi:transcriptional regulator with XRE-family HTH domain
MASYNTSVVTRLIADALNERGYGAQTELAKACGVRVQTVNKWKQGQTSPEPERWPIIEQALGLDEGKIAEEAGYRGPRLPPPGVQAADHDSRSGGSSAGARVATSGGGQRDYNSTIAHISPEAQAVIDRIIDAEERKQQS